MTHRRRILSLLSDGYWRAAFEIAEVAGISREHASHTLLNLYRGHLATRQGRQNTGYSYQITPKGFLRLDYWRSKGLL